MQIPKIIQEKGVSVGYLTVTPETIKRHGLKTVADLHKAINGTWDDPSARLSLFACIDFEMEKEHDQRTDG